MWRRRVSRRAPTASRFGTSHCEARVTDAEVRLLEAQEATNNPIWRLLRQTDVGAGRAGDYHSDLRAEPIAHRSG